MKIRKEEIQRMVEEPIELFYQGIKAKATKEKYTRNLQIMLCDILEDILTGTFEERAAEFVKRGKSDSDWCTSVLLTISKKLKERNQLPRADKEYLSSNSIRRYFKPIKKLLDMNDVPVAWKRINSTFPEAVDDYKGRGYTRQEIQKMLKFASGPLERAIILIAASSGMRVGGFNLKWEDVQPVYKIGDEIIFDITESEVKKAKIVCAMIVVYKGAREEYPSFITPEAYNSLLDYRTFWTKETGKEPKPSDPLFKKEGPFILPLSFTGVKARIEENLWRSGLRTPLVKGMRRHEIPVMNGFRRFFNKTNKETVSKDSPLAALIKKEYMMSHTGLVKLDRNYFQAHVTELVEEYLHAVPNLTISDEERTKEENRKLQAELSDKEKLDDEIQRQRVEIDSQRQRLNSVNQELESIKKQLKKDTDAKNI